MMPDFTQEGAYRRFIQEVHKENESASIIEQNALLVRYRRIRVYRRRKELALVRKREIQ